ncbi:trace amine-associated receptor 13c-like [Lepisosteus oculatus]|uniref:trace amine-associated receptor 13c-like n=1 Tax=Lepisosteus oculatus TaxID=7918 RepID=UPI000740351E|nr:PREDICTED: trace amine-associated receptor 13c-like [Lepisosteus oculatus]
MAVAVGLTVCGNLLVIISISHFRQLHTPTNLILLSLAVADFLVGAFMLPLTVTALIESCWYFGDLLCFVYLLFASILISVSLSNLVLIAIDRYFAVCEPLLYSTKITVNLIQILILLTWFLSPSYTLALGYFNGNFDNADALNACLGECLVIVSESWGIIDIIINFVFPCSTIITLYIKIFTVARRHARLINVFTEKNVEKYKMSKQSERKAAKTLGIVVFSFLFCWVPYYIWTLVEGNVNVSITAFQFSPIVIVYLNSCINPIIYALFYPWFQKSVKLILTFKVCYTDSSFINLFPNNI